MGFNVKKARDWGILAAAVMITVGGLSYIGGGKILGFSVVGEGAGAAQIGGSGGTCPTTGLTNLQYMATYFDLGNSSTTQVNTTTAVYDQDKILLASGTTGGPNSGYVTTNAVNCGTPVTTIIGDGGANYYYAKVDISAVQTGLANTKTSVQLKKSSAGTLTFSNSTSFGQASITLGAVPAGGINTDVTMTFKAGQYYYGDGAQEICAMYDKVNITKISFGATANAISADPLVNVTTGKQVDCYEVTGDLYNYASKEFPVVVQMAPGLAPGGSLVDIYVNDKTAYIKDGVLVPGYWNAETRASLGRSMISKTSAIVFNT